MIRARVTRSVRLRPKSGGGFYSGLVPAGVLVDIVDEHPKHAQPGYVDAQVAGGEGMARPVVGTLLRIDAANLERLDVAPKSRAFVIHDRAPYQGHEEGLYLIEGERICRSDGTRTWGDLEEAATWPTRAQAEEAFFLEFGHDLSGDLEIEEVPQ